MKLAMRYVRLLIGLTVCSVGAVLTIEADIGLSPWDVFHQGVGRLTGLTIGEAGIAVGLVILILYWFLRERFGLGTIFNIVVVGLWIDFIMKRNIIPTAHTMVWSIAYIAVGMFVVGLGSVLYLGAGLGAGPRDGLMVALVRRSGKSVRLIRTLIEGSAFAIGALMGGKFGIGTIIMAATFGFFVQLAFKICRFDVKNVQHRSINEEVAWARALLLKRKMSEN